MSTSRRPRPGPGRHPALLADLYERNRTTLVLAAHTGAQAPAHCKRATSLPYTGAGTTSAGMVAGGLLAAGGLLLLATRPPARAVVPGS